MPRKSIRRGRRTTSCRLRVQAAACEALEPRRALAVHTVTSLADSGPGSLREAIAAANARPGADTVRFAAGLAGVITLSSGEIDVADTLRLDGPSGRSVTVSGGGASRILSIRRGVSAVVDDLVFADGRAATRDAVGPGLVRGGAIRNDGGSLTLSRCDFDGNSAVGVAAPGTPAGVVGGGAIVNSAGAVLVATDCSFTGNETVGGTNYSFGGAIANVTDSRATIVRCRFVGNRASGAPANHGGAVGNFGGSRLVVRDSTFAGNAAGDGARGSATGGAIATRPGTVSTSGSATLVESSRFASNSARAGAGDAARGGALECADSTLTVRRSTFTGNVAAGGDGAEGPAGDSSGGAIEVASLFGTVVPRVRIGGCSFVGNEAIGGRSADAAGTARGGAVSAADGVTEIDRSSFSANVARTGIGRAAGGAIAVGFTVDDPTSPPARLVLRFSSVTANRAVARVAAPAGGAVGGGIHVGNAAAGAAPRAAVVASRFAGNLPTGDAGGPAPG